MAANANGVLSPTLIVGGFAGWITRLFSVAMVTWSVTWALEPSFTAVMTVEPAATPAVIRPCVPGARLKVAMPGFEDVQVAVAVMSCGFVLSAVVIRVATRAAVVPLAILSGALMVTRGVTVSAL